MHNCEISDKDTKKKRERGMFYGFCAGRVVVVGVLKIVIRVVRRLFSARQIENRQLRLKSTSLANEFFSFFGGF